ncbi:MAG: hypothetical protein UT64_C0057G0003 [Candidatus Falkowbacteria bacterium GW2011_GWF2_39_8]|uniref:Uncharacterized protein n=1 Tax=Candidatus Falkowbacteria bacterium GW2011_GWF2_39_8 TaxID=1618642 RepID=A0A0G0PUD4_9BACT|nr:MAG: hypothetical protein UT64_C0057G0003 [Candidatus Falkowbacteria bacterium GW2011_GWF2_39_8]
MTKTILLTIIALTFSTSALGTEWLVKHDVPNIGEKNSVVEVTYFGEKNATTPKRSFVNSIKALDEVPFPMYEVTTIINCLQESGMRVTLVEVRKKQP